MLGFRKSTCKCEARFASVLYADILLIVILVIFVMIHIEIIRLLCRKQEAAKDVIAMEKMKEYSGVYQCVSVVANFFRWRDWNRRH